MKPKTSIVTFICDEVVKRESTSDDGENPTSSLQIDLPIVQNHLLIWLDNNIDDNNPDFHHTKRQLQHVVDTIEIFTDSDQCIEFIEDIENDRISMIISDSLGKHILSRVHNMFQIDSIFIFCGNKEYHEQWAEEWPKIKGVFTEIVPICDAVKQVMEQCEQNTLSISFIGDGTDLNKTLDQIDPSFICTWIVKEILLERKFEQEHLGKFVDDYRLLFVENDRELKKIKKFERRYHYETPIWWYTSNLFLHSMVNRALQLMNMDIIIKIGFFICDLHRHIEQLHKEQFDDSQSVDTFTLYHGQSMSKEEFEKMNESEGGLISFNNFLLTSKNRQIPLSCANCALSNPELVGVLFIITIEDSSQSTTPFAAIADVSYHRNEDEILFAMQSIFRIGDIIAIDENRRLLQVELTLTTDNDEDLSQFTDHIREEKFSNAEGWSRLGLILIDMGQLDKATDLYEILLKQANNDSQRVSIFQQLGIIERTQAKHNEAIAFFEQAIEIHQNNLLLNDLNLASVYNNIGLVYANTNEYTEALSYYEKALEIQRNELPSNHCDLIVTHNNIGLVYDNMGEYAKALPYYEKVLEIQEHVLPLNHPNLATPYNQIGNVYDKMGEYETALSYYEKDLEISQISLPSNHPHLAMSYNNIGLVYHNLGEYSKALSTHEKALEIRQESLPMNHPDLTSSYNNIGSLYGEMGENEKALPYLEKTLERRQELLSPNHPDLAMSYFNIGLLYEKMDSYSEAYTFYEKAVKIGQESLPSDDPDLLAFQRKLEKIKKKL